MMTNILDQFDEVKQLVRLKHQMGRHDQGRHAGSRGGGAQVDKRTVVSVLDRHSTGDEYEIDDDGRSIEGLDMHSDDVDRLAEDLFKATNSVWDVFDTGRSISWDERGDYHHYDMSVSGL